MEMNVKTVLILSVFSLSVGGLVSCEYGRVVVDPISDLYVTDFQSEDAQACRASDVDLTRIEAKSFFIRARQVDYKTIHDHYDVAPCNIEGTVKYNAQMCTWKIRPGATGQIKCTDEVMHFVCDDCADLF